MRLINKRVESVGRSDNTQNEILAFLDDLLLPSTDINSGLIILENANGIQPDEYIGNSRDSSFAHNVLLGTKGKGCEVIVSCVKGQLKSTSLKCIATCGTFVDTVQLQDNEEYELGMFFFNRDRSYVASDISSLFTQEKYDEMKNLQTMLSEGITRGYVRPLSRVSYAPHDATRAFRLLAGSRHRGKVLLRLQDSMSNVYPRLNPDESQLMFWDDGALGVQLADKLVHSGAKKLYIHSTSLNHYQQYKIGSWRNLGVEVVILEKNIDVKSCISAVRNDAISLGIIEGIYVTITKVSDDKHTDELLNSLDVASRSLCPELKYFAVVSTVSYVGQDICIARAKNGFTATYLDLTGLSEIKPSSHGLTEATERALRNTSTVLLAKPAQAHTAGLLQKLIVLAGISMPQNTNPDTTLQELGMEDEKIPIISAFLNTAYNISLGEDTIPWLTLNGLKELVESASDIVPENFTGLATFFTNISSDELLATVDRVVIPTLNKDIMLSHDEFDVNKRYLCIVPGMEGHHERFRVLCERLKLPALVLQPGLDHPLETVQETAQRYAQILINKTRIQNNFYLLGYESGVSVALELAAILEDQGLTGTVFCVGCSPDELQGIIEEQLRDLKTEEQLQDSIIRHMSKLLVGEDIEGLDDVLRNAATWSQKVDASVRILLGRMQHSAQYARGLIEAAMASIERTRSYVAPARALFSQLVLLRAASNVTLAPQALQRYSQRPVAIHQLRTPLSYVSNDLECPAIVNRYLDNEIKSEFEIMNLCDAYCLY